MKNITHFEKISEKQFLVDLKNLGYSCDYEKSYENILLPKRATTSSAGYDFYLPFDIVLNPGSSIIIPTGIRCMMNDDLVLQIYPRSSLGFKYRLQLDNTVGIIDSDYYFAKNEGHIMIKLSNLSFDKKIVNLKQGDAFCQGVFLTYVKTCDDVTTNTRVGGIGSTNK